MNDLDLRAIDRLLAVSHREDDQPCNCDECMSYGAEDNGADWARIPVANRIAIRILDGGDDRFSPLVEAFRDHEAEADVQDSHLSRAILAEPDETPRRWAVFEDEDHTFGIVVEGDGDNLTWPEMNDADCQRVVDEHNVLVAQLAEVRADALDVDALAEAMRPLFDGPEEVSLETLGWWEGEMLVEAGRVAARYRAIKGKP